MIESVCCPLSVSYIIPSAELVPIAIVFAIFIAFFEAFKPIAIDCCPNLFIGLPVESTVPNPAVRPIAIASDRNPRLPAKSPIAMLEFPAPANVFNKDPSAAALPIATTFVPALNLPARSPRATDEAPDETAPANTPTATLFMP